MSNKILYYHERQQKTDIKRCLCKLAAKLLQILKKPFLEY